VNLEQPLPAEGRGFVLYFWMPKGYNVAVLFSDWKVWKK
jgi:hypothetical protein